MKINCNNHVNSFDRNEAIEDKHYPVSPAPLDLASEQYMFIYDYPLSREARITHTLHPTTSVVDILEFACKDYQAIYAAEDAAVGTTANIPGMLNRQQSAGPYGIWGHDISDLYFERVSIDPDTKIVTFCIGS